MGWYLKPGTLLEMGVSDAAAGASELGPGKDFDLFNANFEVANFEPEQQILAKF